MTSPNTINALRAWMRAATPDERRLLAERAGTTVGQLNQLAGGHRQASAAAAGDIERVTTEMHKASKGRLPQVLRVDLCTACQMCQYASKCLGSRAVVSEFPIVREVA